MAGSRRHPPRCSAPGGPFPISPSMCRSIPTPTTYALALLLALFSGLSLRHGPGPPGSPLRSLADHSLRRYEPRQRSPLHAARRAAGSADRHLRCSRHRLAGRRARLGALALTATMAFSPRTSCCVQTDLQMAGYDGDQRVQMQKRMLDAAAAIPGVTAVGYADRLPLSIGGGDSDVFADTTTDFRPTNAAADAQNFNVSPDYFRAAGTALARRPDLHHARR